MGVKIVVTAVMFVKVVREVEIVVTVAMVA